MRRRRHRWKIVAVLGVLSVALAGALTSVADEPLRRELERRMNDELEGYRVTLGWAGLQPLRLAVEVGDLVIQQVAHPEPAVAHIGRLRASVQWRALLYGAVVADVEIERPALHIDRTHVTDEVRDARSIRERGWQDALQTMYPLEINELVIRDGSLSYLDEGPFEPLRITELAAHAENIRNVAVAEGRYPSAVSLSGTVFGRGRLRLDGQANFLQKPQPGVRAAIAIEDLVLDYLAPIAERYNLKLGGGTLSAVGIFEQRPGHTLLHLQSAEITHAHAEYVHTRATATREQARARKTVRAARQVLNEPALELYIDRMRVRESRIGFVNRATQPEYRVFLDAAELSLDNLSNQRRSGAARARLTGRFMGSGDTRVIAVLQPLEQGADLGIDIQMRDTDMRKLNPLLEAYGGLDVARGYLSVYSELSIRAGRIDGYVKPLFRDVDVYALEQDGAENPLAQLYEGLAGGLGGLLENREREEVATKTDLSGPIEDPDTSTLQVVARLVQNAFFKAILPGLDRERRRGTS